MEVADALIKAFTIIFIILILLTNAGLIFKIFGKNLLEFTFKYDAKKLTIVSLAIGDIFLALFTLIVLARGVFEDEPDISCSTRVSAGVYGLFLLNFVYGMGLVVLVVELIFRLKQPISLSTTGSQKNIIAFIVSAIPWGLGLIIILSLAKAAGMWDSCEHQGNFSIFRQTVLYGVSLCLPAILALLAGILVMFVSQSYNFTPAALSLSQIQLQNSTTNVNYDSSTKDMPTQSVTVTEYQTQQNQHAAYSGSPSAYPGNAHSQPPNFPHQDNEYIPQPSNSQPPGPTKFAREKRTLCSICIMHFICVIPIAVFGLGVFPESNGLAVFGIISLILLFLRSVLAPLIWTCRLGD